jgi:drug/metabolite transporter (DMT)-like permease
MSGAIWATVAGIGFGLFQSINRQAVRGMDVWQSTFMQLAVSSVVLLLGALVTEDLGELRSASAVALAAFLAAGLVHFLVGWTLLNASQKRIGAARTSPLLAATPLFGAVLAALTLSEVPGLVTIAGMLLILAGVYVTVGTGEPAEAGERNGAAARSTTAPEITAPEATAVRRSAEPGPASAAIPRRDPAVPAGNPAIPGGSPTGAAGNPAIPAGNPTGAAVPLGQGPQALTATARWRGSLLGLGTAACWSVSPLLIRVGLDRLPNPILGVTISMIGATIPQGVVVAVRAGRGLSTRVTWDSIWLKLAAGVLVGASTWTRWEALALAPVAVVLALSLLSVPTVILVAPLLAGRQEERVTRRIVLGALLVVVGSLVLVVRT